ncbi:MAG: hypothetical protein NTY88_12030 [Bacteroidetes bacterium]|nr:hypothetical protein [Bacteroidota bacterium]
MAKSSYQNISKNRKMKWSLLAILLFSLASCQDSGKNNAPAIIDKKKTEDSIFEASMNYRFYPHTVDSAIIKIEKENYKYIQTYYPGGSMGNFDMGFSLKSLSDTESFILKYMYEPPRKTNGLLSETVEKSRNLRNRHDLDSFLIEKATSDKGGFKKEEFLKLKKSFSL